MLVRPLQQQQQRTTIVVSPGATFFPPQQQQQQQILLNGSRVYLQHQQQQQQQQQAGSSVIPNTVQNTYTSFSNALQNMKIRTFIKGQHRDNCYMVFNSSQSITMRLFIPESSVDLLPSAYEDWQRVQYYFLPSVSKPLECRFVFSTLPSGGNVELVAKLPVTDMEALNFVDKSEIFALSSGRVHHIHQTCLDKYKEPFLQYAIHKESNYILVVTKVTEKDIEVRVEIFFFLSKQALAICSTI